ncbi:MAG: hypothetical protein HY754_12205 [Nitrospirae bacterium]|nr:hypothetical protein [Nitrospirota bacterium]
MKHKYFIFIIAITIFFAAGYPVSAESPRWSLGLRGGSLKSEIVGWEDHYHHKGSGLFGIEAGWKPFRQAELNIDVSYSSAKGSAITQSGRTSSDTVTFTQIPVHLSLLFRLAFLENQIVVPYAGGGYSCVAYRERLNGETVSGGMSGYHVKGGLQFLLDILEPEVAKDFYDSWHVSNTYLFIEIMSSKVDNFGKENIDLGGRSIMGGLLFEF